jgi:hypothetical protein
VTMRVLLSPLYATVVANAVPVPPTASAAHPARCSLDGRLSVAGTKLSVRSPLDGVAGGALGEAASKER